MKNDKRDIRQEKLARLFYEMGMDFELVSKVCKIDEEKLKKIVRKTQ